MHSNNFHISDDKKTPKPLDQTRSCNKFLSLMHIIHVFSCGNSSVILVLFIHKFKNENSGVRFQRRSIPVKFKILFQKNVMSTLELSEFFFFVRGLR